MTDYVHTVTIDFASRDDALALIGLIRELGYEAQMTYRSLNENRSPIRDTRLGILILEHMRPTPGQQAKTFAIDDFTDLLEEHHFKASSAAAALSVLADQGDVERVLRGVYRIKA